MLESQYTNNNQEMILKITGMMCMANCGTAVERTLNSVQGVTSAKVDFANGTASVIGITNINHLIKAIESIGFEASAAVEVGEPVTDNELSIITLSLSDSLPESAIYNVVSLVRQCAYVASVFIDITTDHYFTVMLKPPYSQGREKEIVAFVNNLGYDCVVKEKDRDIPIVILNVTGMMCMKNCGNTVQNSLRSVPGVSRAIVNFESSLALIEGKVNTMNLIDAVENVGFEASVYDINNKLTNNTSESTGLQDLNTLTTTVLTVVDVNTVTIQTKIKSSLMKLDGISLVEFQNSNTEVKITHDVAKCSSGFIIEHILSLGHQAWICNSLVLIPTTPLSSLTVLISGMSCSACVYKIEKSIMKHTGVVSVAVNIATNRGMIVFDPLIINEVQIVNFITELGFPATAVSSKLNVADMSRIKFKEISDLKKLFLVSLALSLPVICIHFIFINIPALSPYFLHEVAQNITVESLIGIILVTPVQFIIGKRFHVNALNNLCRCSMGMDFLISFGTSSAFVYSILSLLVGLVHKNYQSRTLFEASAMLITFVIMGKYMEAIAKGKTSEALTKLVRLTPVTALLLTSSDSTESSASNDKTDSYTETHIEASLIQVKDKLRVIPGSKVPTDGVVISGSSLVDESMITGESMPVVKGPGSTVFGGTINHDGSIVIEATRVGAHTTLAQIINLVEKAQASKAPIQNFADKIAGVFAPCVVALSTLTLITWLILIKTELIPQLWIESFAAGDPLLFALKFAISTAVVACPCALGLATPTAIMVGTGIGANLGVLIKGGAVLEKAHKVTSVLFDKTGTLTEGKPVVKRIFNIGKTYSVEEILHFAASAEQFSEHPLARAVLLKADSMNLKLSNCLDFLSSPGQGVKCTVNGHNVCVGSKRWMIHNSITLTNEAMIKSKEMELAAETIIAVAVNGNLEAFLGVTDTIKPDAAMTIIALNALGLKTWMITGDNKNTAEVIAQEIGIFHVLADVLPSEKSAKVKELQALGEIVAFVGDGVNDSVALAQADVGIAVGSGSDVAVEAADIVLVRNNITDVYTALDLSRVVFNRIRYNFMWAMGYNLLALPLATGVFYPVLHAGMPPQVAGLLMAFSSVSVVMSSLALRLYKRPVLSNKTMRIRHSPFKNKEGRLRDKESLIDKLRVSTSGSYQMLKNQFESPQKGIELASLLSSINHKESHLGPCDDFA